MEREINEQEIELRQENIITFPRDDYYTKNEVDDLLDDKANKNAVDEIIIDIGEIEEEQITQNENIIDLGNDIATLNGDIREIKSDMDNLSLITETGSQIALNVSTTDYKMTASLKDKNGNVIYTSNVIDLPLESVVVNGRYDSVSKKIILTLQNGNEIEFSVADLISGLQSEITTTNKLSSDLVDDTNNTNKFVTTSEKTTWNNKSDFSGNYNDLTNKPTIPTSLSDLSDDSSHRLVTDTEKGVWNNKQNTLVSGTNIKTINNESILGSGNITISGGGGAEVIILQDSATNPTTTFSIDETQNKDALEKIYAEFDDKNFVVVLSTYDPTNASLRPELIVCSVKKYSTNLVIKAYGDINSSYNTNYGIRNRSWYIYTVNASFDSSGNLTSVTGSRGNSYKVYETPNFLGIGNSTSYTPTGNYNPATKKYVDDTVASAIGTALGGSY